MKKLDRIKPFLLKDFIGKRILVEFDQRHIIEDEVQYENNSYICFVTESGSIQPEYSNQLYSSSHNLIKAFYNFEDEEPVKEYTYFVTGSYLINDGYMGFNDYETHIFEEIVKMSYKLEDKNELEKLKILLKQQIKSFRSILSINIKSFNLVKEV